MKKPIYLLLLGLLIALNILCYGLESSTLLHVSQFFIEISALLSFFYILWNLEKSPYTKWIQIMSFGNFISLFRWWKEPFVITKFSSTYMPELYNQYGQHLLVICILILGGLLIKKLELFNRPSL